MNAHQKLLEQSAAFAKNGQYHLAIEGYRELLTHFPNHPEIGLHYSHALGLSGQWKEAKTFHEKIRKLNKNAPELEVRIAQDLELWRDLKGALSCWKNLFARKTRWRPDAAFHQARLLERLNRLDQAQSAIKKAKSTKTWKESWAWHHLEARLAERNGDLLEARRQLFSAQKMVSPPHEDNILSSLARLSDKSGDYQEAVRWLSLLRISRRNEAQKMQRLFPLPRNIHSPIVSQKQQRPDSNSRPQIIFQTGLPRSGTTLLAVLLEKSYQIKLSDEFGHLSQIVDRLSTREAPAPKPEKLHTLPQDLLKKTVDHYWESQKETLAEKITSNDVILDKNPSLALLAPWLLTLIPEMRILWMERNPRDLWLSSVMADLPVNQATCWWQEPTDWKKWHALQIEMGQMLEAQLPAESFVRINYEDFILHPDQTLKKLASHFGLSARNSAIFKPSVVNSPTYAEAKMPPVSDRINRWSHYQALLPASDVEILASL